MNFNLIVVLPLLLTVGAATAIDPEAHCEAVIGQPACVVDYMCAWDCLGNKCVQSSDAKAECQQMNQIAPMMGMGGMTGMGMIPGMGMTGMNPMTGMNSMTGMRPMTGMTGMNTGMTGMGMTGMGMTGMGMTGMNTGMTGMNTMTGLNPMTGMTSMTGMNAGMNTMGMGTMNTSPVNKLPVQPGMTAYGVPLQTNGVPGTLQTNGVPLQTGSVQPDMVQNVPQTGTGGYPSLGTGTGLNGFGGYGVGGASTYPYTHHLSKTLQNRTQLAAASAYGTYPGTYPSSRYPGGTYPTSGYGTQPYGTQPYGGVSQYGYYHKRRKYTTSRTFSYALTIITPFLILMSFCCGKYVGTKQLNYRPAFSTPFDPIQFDTLRRSQSHAPMSHAPMSHAPMSQHLMDPSTQGDLSRASAISYRNYREGV